MTSSYADWAKAGRYLTTKLLAIILVFQSPAICVAQSKPKPAPDTQWSNDLANNPGLVSEFIHLLDRIQREVEFPPARAQSRILPVLPASTVFYAAFPNYGDASHQGLEIFHQELNQSVQLRDWWQHVDHDSRSKVEEFVQRFYELSQYLGDEIVISASAKEADPGFLLVAEVRKPGLKPHLERLLTEFPTASRSAFRVLEPQDLATAKDAPGQPPIILVRPDFVIGSTTVATLRSFTTGLSNHEATTLSATSFGQRLTRGYEGGLSTLGAVDFESILKRIPQETQETKDKQLTLERTGFSEMKYLVWEHKTVAGRDISQAELSFNGPRRGVAAWLRPPHRLGSLDFLSPKPMFAVGIALASPAQIFDDIQELASASASPSHPNPLVSVAPMAQMLGINLKDDLLDLLTGEMAMEVDSTTPAGPVGRVVVGVKDASHFERTLSTLLTAWHMHAESSEQGGLTYYRIEAPSQTKPVEIGYAFVDGYLVIGSSRQAVMEAVHLHRSGGSLGKSQSFLASLPPGHPAGISALLYEEPSAMMTLGLAPAAPGLAGSLAPSVGTSRPVIVAVYGDQDAIREATTSTAFDPAAVLVVAAVAIPNFLRAKIAANDASAVSTLRTVNNAQIGYSAENPQRGFAPNLAVLVTTPGASRTAPANHVSLIDETLANPSCTSNAWCEKNGYRFRVTAECPRKICREFVALAAPVSTSTGGRNFCSTSDGVIRFRLGPPLSEPITSRECKDWQPLE